MPHFQGKGRHWALPCGSNSHDVHRRTEWRINIPFAIIVVDSETCYTFHFKNLPRPPGANALWKLRFKRTTNVVGATFCRVATGAGAL